MINEAGATSVPTLVPPMPQPFDYATLDTASRGEVQSAAERIRDLESRAHRNAFEVGKELRLTKEKVGHGKWGLWLKAEFGWSPRAAQRYMLIYDTLGEKYDTVSYLGAKALYKLTASSTPKVVRDRIVGEIEAGEGPTGTQVIEMIEHERDHSSGISAEARSAGITRPPSVASAQRASELVFRRLTPADVQILHDVLQTIDVKAFINALKIAVKTARSGQMETVEL